MRFSAQALLLAGAVGLCAGDFTCFDCLSVAAHTDARREGALQRVTRTRPR